MSALSLYVLRHGEPADLDVVYGQLDVDLSDRGHEQIRAQVRALAEVRLERILTSDLQRTALGAQALAEAQGVPAESTPALREMHIGVLEGLTRSQALAEHPELASRPYRDMLDYRFPGGGESVLDVAARTMPVVEDAVGAAMDRGERCIAIYTHNTVARLLVAAAAGVGPVGYMRFKHGFGSISRIDFSVRDAGDPWGRSSVVWSNREPA